VVAVLVVVALFWVVSGVVAEYVDSVVVDVVSCKLIISEVSGSLVGFLEVDFL